MNRKDHCSEKIKTGIEIVVTLLFREKLPIENHKVPQ